VGQPVLHEQCLTALGRDELAPQGSLVDLPDDDLPMRARGGDGQRLGAGSPGVDARRGELRRRWDGGGGGMCVREDKGGVRWSAEAAERMPGHRGELWRRPSLPFQLQPPIPISATAL
jgi:hypothetical protein